MRRTIAEFGHVLRSDIGDRLAHRLQRLDERYAQKCGEQIFDWGRIREIKAKNYVGVVQVPGLSIEIIPKIDAADDDSVGRAQGNLLYMLQLSRNLPLRQRDLADQHLRRKPLLEALIQAFASSLLSELRAGVHHAYV